MSDFFQNGIVTSLHELGQRPAADLMAEVERYASERPITLVLPCLYAELQGPALDPIVRGLAELPWLAEIVIGLDQADGEGYRHARRYFSRLPQPHHVIWNDGPRVQALVADLAAQRLAPADRGKGHNIWLCLGLAQATGVGQVVALHDCDVLTFEPRSLARLVYPVIHPTANFVFAKAYYPRISEAGLLYGRVSRLFVTPLLRALMRCLPPSRYLDFLNSFRYPLRSAFSPRCSGTTPPANFAKWPSPTATTTSTSPWQRGRRTGAWPAWAATSPPACSTAWRPKARCSTWDWCARLSALTSGSCWTCWTPTLPMPPSMDSASIGAPNPWRSIASPAACSKRVNTSFRKTATAP